MIRFIGCRITIIKLSLAILLIGLYDPGIVLKQLKRVHSKETIMTEEEEIRKAVEAEREACAKLCDLTMLQNQQAINELENDEHIAECFIQGAMNQLVKTAKAIRARGKA
jgi:hypothetical protein